MTAAATHQHGAARRPSLVRWVPPGLRPLAPAGTVLVAQLVLFPLPLGLAVKGLVIGLPTALIALGMAVTYRSNRIVNFAQGDLGTAPVVVVFMLLSAWRWPYPVALLVGLVASLAVGAVVELAVIRRFFRAPRLLLTVATLGLAQLLAASAILLPRLWGEDRLLSPRIPTPFDWKVTVGTGGGAQVLDANALLTLIAAPLAIALVATLLRGTNVGIAVRASADDADRASLLGVPVKRLQTVVWATTALLAFVAVFLRAGVSGLPIGAALSFGLLLRALAALVLGGMTDLVGVTAASLALGLLEQGITFNYDSTRVDPIFAAVIFLALFLVRQRAKRVALDDSSTWLVADDVRPVPDALARLPVVRAVRWGGSALVVAVVLWLPSALSVDRSLKASALMIYAILGLSLVVLTGWAGQISLGQIGFFALGAAIGAKATADWGLDLTLALLLAAAAGAVVAVVVGLPALRTRGLYLAVVTLAFSLAMTSWVLNASYFGWVPTSNDRIPRRALLGRVDIDSATGMYLVALGVLVLCLLGLRGVRRSRTGRALLALRDNERGAQAYGLDATRVRLTAFAMSGALAALAGCLLALHQQAYDPQLFDPGGNLSIFVMVIVGGVATPFGAVLGALYLQGTKWFLPTEWQLLATGGGVLFVLLVLPDGLGGLLFRLRDRWLRRVSSSWGRSVEQPAAPPVSAVPAGGGR